MDGISMRDARHGDCAAISAIYNHYVLTDTCTYTEEPETTAEREHWLAAHGPRHPVVVLVHGAEVVAWGSLSPFRPRIGYRHTVEDSVYCREDWCGKGLGWRLLETLVARGRAIGHHAIIAGISADQPRSLALHRRAGFVEVARMPEVGCKFGRWLELVYLQLMLNADRHPPDAPQERASA